MHEREGSAGMSVEMPQKTVWYGMGKAVEKGVNALGPDAWRKRILHVIDTQIIPRSNPKWQEWAKKHREEIEAVAAHAGVNITVVEIALGSVAIIAGAKRLRKIVEMNRMNKKLDKRWGMYPPSSTMELKKIAWYKKLPSDLGFFQEQIYKLSARKIGIRTSRRLSDVVSTLADPKFSMKQVNNWNQIVRLANSGSVAAASVMLEHVFTAGVRRASGLHGWDKEIPKQYQKIYAKTLLSLWLNLPQVEEFAGRAVYNNDYSPQEILDAFARIRDHVPSQSVNEMVSPVPQNTRLSKHIQQILRGQRENIDVGLIGGIPISHIDATALDHVRSLSHQEEARLIGNVQDAVDEREKVRALKSDEPYFVVDHDFAKEEQMVADMKAPAKDYLGKPITYPRDFSYHGDGINSRRQELGEVMLERLKNTKPAQDQDIEVSSDDKAVSPAEPEIIATQPTAPETFLEPIQRIFLKKEHVRGTRNRLKRIAQARKDYAKKHPSKTAG